MVPSSRGRIFFHGQGTGYTNLKSAPSTPVSGGVASVSHAGGSELLSGSPSQTSRGRTANHPTRSKFSPARLRQASRGLGEWRMRTLPGLVPSWPRYRREAQKELPPLRLTVSELNPFPAVKMSLYPSLEDLKVDKVIQAQTSFASNPANPAILSEASAPIFQDGNLYPKLYPELSQYMGLNLNDEEIQRNLAMIPATNSQGLVARPSASDYVVAPVSGNDVGIRRAEIKQGIREVILCKDQDGKIGLRLKSVDNGVFVQLVQANSPASLAGLRFGDQVLQISGDNCAGWSSDKAHKVLKQAPGERISMIIRDRPFERTITMHKDSTGHVGFIFKNGKITSIVKDSSAARNGLLTEHNICEINGQNIIGLKDSQIADVLSTAGNVVTITIMPSQIFEHIIKRMASSIMKSLMDHTIPEV